VAVNFFTPEIESWWPEIKGECALTMIRSVEWAVPLMCVSFESSDSRSK
jgi:hypothetical protein